MTAVLTTTMTLRIILSVRGSLEGGGIFTGDWSTSVPQSQGTNGVPTGRGNTNSVLHINSQLPPGGAYTLDGIQKKAQGEWMDVPGSDHKVPLDTKETGSFEGGEAPGLQGVRITVDREVIEMSGK